MKRQNYILNINNPCNQDWKSMTKSNTGKFCSNCSKTVIDFTLLTDQEIIKIVEQTPKLCGRLNQQQINRSLETKQQTNNSRLYKTLTGLVLLTSTINSFAKINSSSKIEIVSITNEEVNTPPQEKEKTEPITDNLKNVIQGKVIDKSSKEPLPAATVLFKNTKTVTTTDFDGKFKLIIPDSLLTDKIHIIISYVGYENTEITINKATLPQNKDFFIIPVEPVLMGEIVVIKQKKWWQFWKSKQYKH